MPDHPMPSSATRVARLALLAAAWLIGIPAEAGEQPPDAPAPAAVLNLTNGGYAPGKLEDSDRPGVIRWRSPSFVSPFDFDVNGVNTVHFPAPPETPGPGSDACFELAGGDLLFGALVEMDEREALLDVPRIGQLRVPRAELRRIDRWRDRADLIYLGPNGLAGWREPSPKDGWREEAGRLRSELAGASILGDLNLPARAAIEFEIAWKNKPDFVLALGVSEREATIEHAFRFEVWDGELVARREGDREADVASLQEIAAGPGRVRLQAYLDQEQGRLRVFSADGKPLADLSVAGRKVQTPNGVYLANLRGETRLERLKIVRWDGELPREAREGESRLQRDDGTIAYGRIRKFDAASKEFVIREEAGESRSPVGRISSVVFAPPDAEPAPRSIRAVYRDGTRLSGDLVKVEQGDLWLKTPGVEEPARLPSEGLRSLVALRHGEEAPADGGRAGVLEIEGVRLPGRLKDGRESPGASCLAWQPFHSASASPLRPGLSGRIIYKETVKPRQPGQPAPAAPAGVAVKMVRPRVVSPATSAKGPRRSLYLRTGDTIPAEVTRIDEEGVRFKTPLSDGTFVPHAKVKAVELAAESGATVRLSKSKRERLLTLPRMQKGNPPTHLIRSRGGDYLRGRLIGLDGETLRIEVRLETREVPRDRVAQIIWLHPDETGPTKDAPSTPDDGGPTRVQAVRGDGSRLTFTADHFQDGTLHGKSDVLGACRVRVDEIDQLLFGGAIEAAAARLAYQQWKLHPAEEPKVASEDGAPPASGTESPLVGKPAPDFELALLDGKKFRLADRKGKVVVLDFWATWCGPCLQAMPQVEKVAHEFRDLGVQLVAVNLQETPEQISAMLERHKLSPTVALDRDGVVAEKYAAAAIPQTVVIDRDGKVARLFVGGGPHLGDQLRETIRSLLPGGAPDEPMK